MCKWIAAALLASLYGCGTNDPAPQATSTAKESWDVANRPAILGARAMRFDELIEPNAQRGAMPTKPWRDSYWPYHRKNIASRYATGREFSSLAEQIADAAAAPTSVGLSPAEKYDMLVGGGGFPLTRDSWDIYNYYRGKYGDDLGKWSWMGICAGWAPAAIAEPAPSNHVLAATADGREILFFAGDIRALLSKAYDINATTDKFKMIGSRCNDPEYALPRDALGRSVDGRINGTFQNFNIISDFGRSLGVLQVTDNAAGPNSYWLVASAPLGKMSGTSKFWRYDRREDVAKDLAAETRGAHASLASQIDVQLFKSCRDVNPASLHFAMVQNLSDAATTKSSFVVELSRDVEVWNHPVWAFDAKLAKPRAVATDPLERRIFRASGTTQLVDVRAKLIYVSGAAPQVEYRNDDHAVFDWHEFDFRPWVYPSLDLDYTLELDASGLVIGGEWQESATARLALPDFFWKTYGQLTDDLKDGGPSPLKYSLLRQLADCSRRTPDTDVPSLADGSGHFPAVRCAL